MDKRTYSEGFALLEVMMSIACISILTLLFMPNMNLPSFDHYLFIYDYIEFQSECISFKQTEEFVWDGNVNIPYPIIFNDKGYVQIAQTIEFPNMNHQLVRIVSNLGGGRLVVK